MNKEVYQKLLELWELLKVVPEDCKGTSPEAYKNRREWMHIRTTIHQLIKEEDE